MKVTGGGLAADEGGWTWRWTGDGLEWMKAAVQAAVDWRWMRVDETGGGGLAVDWRWLAVAGGGWKWLKEEHAIMLPNVDDCGGRKRNTNGVGDGR